jgi:hypothetical protein
MFKKWQCKRVAICSQNLKHLADDDMAKMTACDPWTVKHLLASLTALGNQSFPNFALGILKNRGNFHKFTDSDLQKYLKGSAVDMIAGLEKTLSTASHRQVRSTSSSANTPSMVKTSPGCRYARRASG